jgi:hypothetical protein
MSRTLTVYTPAVTPSPVFAVTLDESELDTKNDSEPKLSLRFFREVWKEDTLVSSAFRAADWSEIATLFCCICSIGNDAIFTERSMTD